MGKSNRHHYVPEFVIKKFTDDEELLYVYDKEHNKIVSSKRSSPKAIFFEMHRNTFEINGEESDNLEKLYTEFDTRISIDLESVLKTNTWTQEELISVMVLASQLKWRVPKIDNQFNIIKEDLTQEQLGIKITVKDKNDEIDPKAIEYIQNSTFFKEAKRVLIPIVPFLKEENLLEIYNNSFIYTNPNFPALIGDCPVIEKANNNINIIEDFIFPLSSDATFIFKKGTAKEVINYYFCFQRDVAVIDSAVKYVGCKSKEHLEKMVAMYNVMKNDNTLRYNNQYLFGLVR